MFDALLTMSLFAAGKTPVIYVSDPNDSAIYEYLQAGNNQQPIAEITLDLYQPIGLKVDEAGNLWVANQFGHNLLVFKPGQSNPSKTYTDATFNPIDVAICKDRTVYAADYGTSNSPGGVSIYKHGSMSPTGYIYGSPIVAVTSVTCDPKGNLYYSWADIYNNTRIEQCAPGGSRCKELPITQYYPTNIAIWEGDLVASDWEVAHELLFFHLGMSQPYKTISGFASPHQFAFDKAGKQIWVADAGRAIYSVDASSGKFTDTITTTYEPYGIAAFPPN